MREKPFYTFLVVWTYLSAFQMIHGKSATKLWHVEALLIEIDVIHIERRAEEVCYP